MRQFPWVSTVDGAGRTYGQATTPDQTKCRQPMSFGVRLPAPCWVYIEGTHLVELIDCPHAVHFAICMETDQMRRSRPIAIAVCVGLLLASFAKADHLPPVDPILPGTDHAHENHDGHDHSGLVMDGDFRNASFRGANLFLADLSSNAGNLDNVDFTGATFEYAYFNGSQSGVNYSNAVFRFSRLNDQNFYDSTFLGADFSSAILDEVTFVNSTLRGANFQSSTPPQASLSSGVLENVDLRDIDFHGLSMTFYMHGQIDMRGTNLRGAIFSTTNISEANDLSRAIFDSTTIYDAYTVFPPGFDPVARGLTFVPEPSTLALAAFGALGLLIAARRRRLIPIG